MIVLNVFRVSKDKKILLPGILNKDLKPVSSLLTPIDIIVPIFFIAVIAQITDNLKNTLDTKDIQNLFSVKAYRRLIFSGFNCVSLSVIYAISKTLGPELETLSVLSVHERVLFLKELQSKIMLDRNTGKIDFRQRNLNNPFQLMKHRKGLSIQARSVMVATALFSPNSILIGAPVCSMDLNLIIHSSKLIWLSLGLTEEDFEFLLKKDAINKSKSLTGNLDFFGCLDNVDCLRTILYFDLKYLLGFTSFLDLSSDNVVFQGEKNLVLLEKEIGFIQRDFPVVPDEVFVSEDKLDDVLLRSALEQRRMYKLSFDNVFTTPILSTNKNMKLVKQIKFKKFLNKN